MIACKSLPKHYTHFIPHRYVNKQHDSSITQSMSGYISCLVFSITLRTNCHKFLPSARAYYQDSYLYGRQKNKYSWSKLKDGLTFFWHIDIGICVICAVML